MKKTVFALLLAAVLLVGVVALTALPAEADTTEFGSEYHCLCGKTVYESADAPNTKAADCVCDGENRTWNPWKDAGLPKTGYWYLTRNYENTQDQVITANTYIDFHGQTVTGMYTRVARMIQTNAAGIEVVLTDSRGGGTVKAVMSGITSNDTQGGVLWVRNNDTVTVYGVTLDGSGLSGNQYGAAVAVEPGATFSVYGGTIKGGTTTAASGGGAIGVNGAGTVNLYNGAKIEGGKATKGGAVWAGTGTLYIDGATITGASSTDTGGAIYLGANTNVITEIKNATITGCSATSGGALFIGKRTTVFTDCQITDCTATNGGAVYVEGGTVNFNSGATVTGGTATGNGGAVYVNAGTVNFNSGAKVTGGKANNGGAIYANSTVNIDGATITGTATGANGADHAGGAIYIAAGTTTIDSGTISGEASRAGAVGVYGGTLNIYGGTLTGKANQTGKGGQNGGVIFQSAGTINISGGTITGTAGNMGGAVASGGGTIKFSGGTVKDCYGPGGGGAFYLAGGKLCMSDNATIENCKTDNNTSHFGGAIHMTSNSNNVFEMTGDAMITGCYAGKGGAIYAHTRPIKITDNASIDGTAIDQGGAILVQGPVTVEISGNAKVHGKITTTSTTDEYGGGAITLYDGAPQVTISGNAEVSGTGSKGGAIYTRYSTGKVTVEGNATVTGTATKNHGGAMYIFGGTVEIKDNATISGSTVSNGGCIFINKHSEKVANPPVLTITGGTFNGTADNQGGVLAAGASTVTFSGGTMKGTGGGSGGGAIYISGATVTMSGTAKIHESTLTKGNGGALYMGGSGSFTMEGGIIENCNITARGGAIAVAGATVNLNGGIIQNCKAAYGGALYVAGGTTNLNGTTIENCSATDNGGAVFAVAGTFNIKKGTISGGHADNMGGSLGVDGGTVNITGGTITGGSAKTEDSANVFHVRGSVTMSSGAIEGGYLLSNADAPQLILKNNAYIVSEGGPSLTAYNGANITVKTLDDADIRVTMTGSNPNGQVFATQGEGFTGDMLERVSYDGNTNLHPVLEGDKLVWQASVQIGKVPYASVSDAMTAYGDGSDPIKLLTDVSENVVLNKNIVLDLNGKKLTGNISGNYKLSGIDSTSTASGAGTNVGRITGDVDVTVTVTDAAQVNDAIYVHVVEDNVHSFHRIELVVTSVSLRPMAPNEPGLYFKSQIKGDKKALDNAAWLGCFGSAFTKIENAGTDSDPTSNENKQYICSEFRSDKLGAKVPGTLVSGILTSKEDGNPLDKVLYCRTYMVTKDGDAFFGSQVGVTPRYMLEWVDNNWSSVSNNEKQRVAFLEMYDAWHERLAELVFTFNNVGKQG